MGTIEIMNNIKIETNTYFKKHFQDLDCFNCNFKLSNNLKSLLKEGIIEKYDSYFFKSKTPEGCLSSDFYDCTGNEAFYNKINIDDYSDVEDNNHHHHLIEGVLFAKSLIKNLLLLKCEFNLYLSYDGDYCIFTFHKKRKGEYWLVDDLDNYNEDAVILFEIIK